MWIRWAAFAILCSMTAALSHAAAATENHNLEEVWLATSVNGQQSDEVDCGLR